MSFEVDEQSEEWKAFRAKYLSEPDNSVGIPISRAQNLAASTRDSARILTAEWVLRTSQILGTFDIGPLVSAPPPPAPPPPPHKGGGEPYDGQMEARVKALEQFAVEARDRLSRIEVKLDAVAVKVADLPSKDFVGHEISKSSNKIILWVAGISGAAQLIPSMVVPLLKHFGV